MNSNVLENSVSRGGKREDWIEEGSCPEGKLWRGAHAL